MEKPEFQIKIPKKDFTKAVKHISARGLSVKLADKKDIKHDTVEFANVQDKDKAKKILKALYGTVIGSDPDWDHLKETDMSFKDFYLGNDK